METQIYGSICWKTTNECCSEAFLNIPCTINQYKGLTFLLFLVQLIETPRCTCTYNEQK